MITSLVRLFYLCLSIGLGILVGWGLQQLGMPGDACVPFGVVTTLMALFASFSSDGGVA